MDAIFHSLLFILSFLGICPPANLLANSLLIGLLCLKLSISKRTLVSTISSILTVSIGSTLAYIPLVTSAFGFSIGSLLGTLALSIIHTCWAITLILCAIRLSSASSKSPAPFFPFAIVWAAGWYLFGSVSPLGRQGDWTVYGPEVDALSGWITRWTGEIGIDIVLATLGYTAYAILGKSDELVRHLVDNVNRSHRLIDVVPEDEDESRPQQRSVYQNQRFVRLAPSIIFLFAITLPNHLLSPIPRPDSDSLKPSFLPITCVLPHRLSPHSNPPTFKHYLHETEQLSSSTKVLIWPESSVRFSSKEEMDKSLSQVSEMAKMRKAVITLGFVAPYHAVDTSVPHNRVGDKLANAMTLFDTDGVQRFVYIKRHLIPIVETFPYLAGDKPLPHTNLSIPLQPARSANPKRPDTVSLVTSSAICHDTSYPYLMTSEASSSNLLITPSSIWSSQLAFARLNSLSVRARTNGLNILTCDGGSGGISSLVDSQGRIKSFQVGNSQSFSVELQLETEEEEIEQTFFVRLGPWKLILTLTGIYIITSLWRTFEMIFERNQSRFNFFWIHLKGWMGYRIENLDISGEIGTAKFSDLQAESQERDLMDVNSHHENESLVEDQDMENVDERWRSQLARVENIV